MHYFNKTETKENRRTETLQLSHLITQRRRREKTSREKHNVLLTSFSIIENFRDCLNYNREKYVCSNRYDNSIVPKGNDISRP